jgi:NTE family protein
VFNRDAVVGSLLEYGNAWQDRSRMAFSDGVLNGSIYIGLDSLLGPLMFGIGGREGGERNIFVELGHGF